MSTRAPFIDESGEENGAAILMLDVKGYSKMNSWAPEQVFTALLSKINAELGHPRYKNSWGDGVIAVFQGNQSATEAAKSALNILQLFTTGKAAKILHTPDLVEVRIGLHFASVNFGLNAISGKEGCYGEGIGLCARIEPVVEPNNVWFTQEFKDRLEKEKASLQYYRLLKITLPKDAGYELLFELAHKDSAQEGQECDLGFHPDGVRPTPDGIVSAEKFRHETNNKRLSGEVFAIELLTAPVKIKREAGTAVVTVSRREVEQYVITNHGKSEACRLYMGNQTREKIIEEDKQIHEFLLDKGGGAFLNIELRKRNRRLRWASGGVLSIVKWRGCTWVPLFFRDIPPYGWNISLGNSERYFSKNGALRSVIDHELDHPEQYIMREFLEETLVFRSDAACPNKLIARQFATNNNQTSIPIPIEFAREHIRQREQEEDWKGITYDPKRINVVFQPTNVVLQVESSTSQGETGNPPLNNVLVAFSLLDLGIEVVKVAKYSLENDDFMLDGEMLHLGLQQHLIRMPIALFSIKYLTKVFTNEKNWFHYTHGDQPSIQVRPAPKAKHVHLFEWDVQQRMRFVRPNSADANWPKDRFTSWYHRFGRHHFLNFKGNPSRQHLPNLFVPGTAKILSLWFTQNEGMHK